MLNLNLKDGLMINAILTGITGLGLALFAKISAIYLIPGAPVWLISALGIALQMVSCHRRRSDRPMEIRIGTGL